MAQEPPGKLVRIRTFSGPTAHLEAELARNILREEGIPGALPGELSVALPGIDVVQLLVRKEDAEEAAEILQGYLASPAPPSAD